MKQTRLIHTIIQNVHNLIVDASEFRAIFADSEIDCVGEIEGVRERENLR